MLAMSAGRELLWILFICSLPEWLPGIVEGQLDPLKEQGQGQAVIELPPFTNTPAQADAAPTEESAQADVTPAEESDCREEKYPCTRMYSVQKPMKQCLQSLCVTRVRRVYVINKELCSRIVCKETEEAQDEICRQLYGLPPRRFRRSSSRLCKRAAGDLKDPPTR